MVDSDRPRSPFADLSGRQPLRVLSPDAVEQVVASHRLYRDTEYREGPRANFSSANLTGRGFSGLNLRGIKMDRAALRGADFTGARLQSANLIGAIVEQARFERSVSGAPEWRQPGLGQLRRRPPRQGRDGVRADGQRDGAGRLPVRGRYERGCARWRRAYPGRLAQGKPARRWASRCAAPRG